MITDRRKITPFFWFDDEAEAAANFYTGIFRNSRITSIARPGDAGPRPRGSVMTVAFELEGQPFTALNGGPQPWKFNQALSLVIHCADAAKSARVMRAMMGMIKLDLPALEKACPGE